MDYIGSSRMIYDMKQNKFPIENNVHFQSQSDQLHIDDIAFFVEINQIGRQSDNKFFAHVDGSVYSTSIRREKVILFSQSYCISQIIL
jgi:hypothetical protein